MKQKPKKNIFDGVYFEIYLYKKNNCIVIAKKHTERNRQINYQGNKLIESQKIHFYKYTLFEFSFLYN